MPSRNSNSESLASFRVSLFHII